FSCPGQASKASAEPGPSAKVAAQRHDIVRLRRESCAGSRLSARQGALGRDKIIVISTARATDRQSSPSTRHQSCGAKPCCYQQLTTHLKPIPTRLWHAPPNVREHQTIPGRERLVGRQSE